jgi:hypothetical protein
MISSLAEQTSCASDGMLALFGTKLYTSAEGGLLQVNDCDVYLRTDVDTQLFRFADQGQKPAAS